MICNACTNRIGKHPWQSYRLHHPLTGIVNVVLCQRCAQSIPHRNLDPLLVGGDGRVSGGKLARQVWRNVINQRLQDSMKRSAPIYGSTTETPKGGSHDVI